MALPFIYIILIELSSALVMVTASDGFYCHGKMPQPKETWERKRILSDTPASQPIIKGSQGRNRSRSHRGVILSGLLLMALSVFFLCTIHDHLFRCNHTNSGLGPSTPIMYQEYTQADPQTDLMGAFAQLRFHPLR